MVRVGLLGVALALVATGCGARTASDHGAQVKRIKPSDVTTKIVGATPAQEKLLREILSGLEPALIKEVKVFPATSNWTPSLPHSVVIHFDSAGSRGYWEGVLLAEAFHARAQTLGLAPVTAYETDDGGSSLEGDNSDWLLKRKPVTADEIVSQARSAAKASDADLVWIRILKPNHLAAAMTLRVDDPAAFLSNRLQTFYERVPSLTEAEYDGLYMLVIDREGNFVSDSGGTASESGVGGAGGTRPDLEGCVPDFGGTLRKPPPCPVGQPRAQ